MTAIAGREVAPLTGHAGTASAGLRGFHPGWFGAVMGTAVVGIVAYQNPGGAAGAADAGHAVGVLMVALAAVLAVVLGVPYVARWVRHPAAAMADLLSPAVGGLHGTFPAGLLVLALGAATVGPSVADGPTVSGVVIGLGIVGSALALAVGVAFAVGLVLRPEVEPQAVNGSWFIPPVAAVIVPVVLAAIAPRVSPADLPGLVAAGYAALGIGLLLFVVVFALLYGRLVMHPLPAAPLAPSLWIALGPAGVGALAMLRLAAAAGPAWADAAPAVGHASAMAATAIWGFGLWWLVLAAIVLAVYRRRGAIPFSVGWWGFTFPLGAFDAATLAIARTWKADWIEALGVLLFALLLVFWAAVAAQTLRAVRTGSAWAR